MNLNLRLLATVKRWQVIHTIQQQSNAEHVALGCLLCEDLFNHVAFTCATREDVLRGFACHDILESISSDLPGSVNSFIKDIAGEHWRAPLRKVAKQIGLPNFDPSIQVRAIVRYIDLLESLHFIMQERLMGNRLVDMVYASIVSLTDNAYRKVCEHHRDDIDFHNWHRDQVNEAKFSILEFVPDSGSKNGELMVIPAYYSI